MTKKLAALAALFLLAGVSRAAELPRKAPDVTINLPGGKQAKLSEYRGKVVVVIFIMTTCPHCQKTTQTLSGLQKELGSQGFQVFEAAMDPEGLTAVPGFIQRFQPAFQVGAIDYNEAREFMGLPNARNFVPFMAFVDREGMIQAQYTGGDPFLADEATQEKSIRDEIVKLLAEGPKMSGKKHAK